MSAIALSSDHLTSIRTHAEQAYPNECCGLILGTVADEIKTVVEIWPTENAWLTQAADQWPEQQGLTERGRYAVKPEAMLEAMKAGRDRHLSIIGIYHSHPDCPAKPSEFDRICAWSQYSYIIVSVQQGKAEDLCNWSLDSQGYFQPEEILTLEANESKKIKN